MTLGASLLLRGRGLGTIAVSAATIGLLAPDPAVQDTGTIAVPPPASMELTSPDPFLNIPGVVSPTPSVVAITGPDPVVRFSALAPGVTTLVLAAPGPAISNPGGSTWANGYVAYRDIVIPAGAVAATLADLSVLFSETLQGLSFATGFVESEEGNDIRFESVTGVTATTGTKLAHVLAKYDDATGETAAILKVTSVTSSRVFLRLYYGKASIPSEQDSVGLYSDARAAWNCVSGRDEFASALHLSPQSSTVETGFVSVAVPRAFTVGQTVWRPATGYFDFHDENVFIPNQNGMPNTTDVTIDLRDRVFHHHELPDGQISPIRPKQLKTGTCIVGAEIVGAQPDNTLWRIMKTANPAAMDDNGILFDNMDVNNCQSVYIENCVFRKSFDGVNTNTLNRSTRYYVRGCYAERQRDEFVENDGQCEIEFEDVLVTSCHNILSMRAGKNGTNHIVDINSPVEKRVKMRYVIARCRTQYYNTDAGGTPTGPRQKRTQPWPNGTLVTSTSSAPGYCSREFIKGSGIETQRATTFMDCANCLFAYEIEPVSDELVMPPGIYVDCALCYFGDPPTPLKVNRPGITLYTGNVAYQMYRDAAMEWLTAHGCTNISSLDADFNGADFPFLHV